MVYGIGNGQYAQLGLHRLIGALNCMHDQQAILGGGAELKGEDMKTVVRRLTPLECERLQGFPDNWTDIGEWVDSKGKLHKEADSPRYKALGNSIAVGFANNQSGFWMVLMKRISAQYERSATLGSMFDGISGFPLAWARYNGAENCRWSSEIEEFPIAVCKRHFGDEEAGIEGDIGKYL